MFWQMQDLYTYFCRVGLWLPSPRLRAACLSMVPTLAAADVNYVSERLLPRLLSLITDEWWEVRASLVVAAAAILRQLRAGEGDKIVGIINAVMKTASVAVTQVCDCAMVSLWNLFAIVTNICPDRSVCYVSSLA